MITLIGPPDFADGVFFVPLTPVTDINLVASTVAHTLGFPEMNGEHPDERLIAGIGQRHMLIVLENLEQIIEAAPLAAQLLRMCPNLKIMVTSRESLRVPGEWLYPVPPLAVPAEVQVQTLADPGH